MQFGMHGFYGRARYSSVDNSVDFTLSDYKGSVKYKLNAMRHGKPIVTLRSRGRNKCTPYNIMKNIFILCNIIKYLILDGADFEGELKVVGSDNRRTIPIDASVKVSYNRSWEIHYPPPRAAITLSLIHI